MSEKDLHVTVTNRSGEEIDLSQWGSLLLSTLSGEKVAAGVCDLSFVDLEEMAALNAQHMDASGPTDVLSFPLDAAEPSFSGIDALPRLLGDIIICWGKAVTQAAAQGCTIEEEVSLLTIHGALHLLGHDHAEPEETKIMQARERFHLEKIGYQHRVDA